MICELCGKESGAIRKITIEGSVLMVCPNCTKFGIEPEVEVKGGRGAVGTGAFQKDVSIQDRLAQRKRRLESMDVLPDTSARELVEDYHRVIQQARMAMGLNQEELARKLNERKSIIAKLETKSIKPDNKLIRKLEKTLKITLMENVE